jgi:hypothetical protein
MKITMEGQSRMVLKDHNYTQYLMGFVFFAIGAGVAYIFMSELVPLAIGGIFALVGIYLVAITKMVTITLDKASSKGTVSLRGLIGGGTREIDLGKVRKVVLRKTLSSTRSSKGGSSTNYVYTVAFSMDGGEELPFELATVSAGITDVLLSPDERQKGSAKQIADFLGAPFEFVPAPSIGDALNAIKEGIAAGMERQKGQM